MAMERDRRTTPRRSCRSVAPAVALLLASALVTSSDRAEARPTFDVAYDVGSAAYQQGKHALAAEHLAFALRHWPPISAVAHLKPTAQQRLATSRAQAGALAVTVSAPLAEVLVDGKPAGKAPLAGERFVEPGEHTLEARLDGYAPAQKSVRVGKGETAAVTLAMAAAKGDAARKAGETEGTMAVRHAPVTPQPAAKPGLPVAVPAHVEQRSWVPVIALGAASAVALGVAVGTTVTRNKIGDDVDVKAARVLRDGGQCARPPDRFVEVCAEISRAGRRGAAFGDAARVAYIALGTLAIAATVYALWPRGTAPATTHVQASAGLGSDHVVLYARGAW